MMFDRNDAEGYSGNERNENDPPETLVPGGTDVKK
jgi:hypothetical protein